MSSTGENKETSRLPPALRRALPLLGLAPDGGCLAAALLRSPVVSYTTFSPLPPQGRSVSVALSGSCLPRALPGILPYGVRTFLDAASGGTAITRPAWILILPPQPLAVKCPVDLKTRFSQLNHHPLPSPQGGETILMGVFHCFGSEKTPEKGITG